MNDLADDLKRVGISVLDANEPFLNDVLLLGVKIEVSFERIPQLETIRLKWLTKRKTDLNIHDFSYDETNKVLSFLVTAPLHVSFQHSYGIIPIFHMEPIANTFVDFCWIHQDGTTPESKSEVNTPIQQDAVLGDLTWVLPSKFADDLIEAMHVMNSAVLEGILEHSVIYGPYLLERK